MPSQFIRSISFTAVKFCLALFCFFTVFAATGSASDAAAGSETGRTPFAAKSYTGLDNLVSDCSPTGQMIQHFKVKDPLAPAATLCIAGSLAGTDADFLRPSVVTTGSGISGPCVASIAADYDVYSFNLTGCAAFPTDLTMTLCGPGGCAPVAGGDPVLYLYRNVAAGDPLTANGGLPGVFDPSNPCTNARAANQNLNGGAASVPGSGNTCNQANTADCIGACAANNNTAGFKRRLGNGRFTLVVSMTGSADPGAYNLFIDAPGAGCSVALAPSAANSTISGRVTSPGGRGIPNTLVTITGGSIVTPVVLRTNPFGYYESAALDVGQTYTVSVTAKGMTFANPTRIISLQDNITDANFETLE